MDENDPLCIFEQADEKWRFRCDDVEAFVAWLRENGWTIDTAPHPVWCRATKRERDPAGEFLSFSRFDIYRGGLVITVTDQSLLKQWSQRDPGDIYKRRHAAIRDYWRN